MKKAIITGITGQDGGYLAKLLLDKGYKVYGAQRRNTGKRYWRLDELGIRDDIEIVDIDLTEPYNIDAFYSEYPISEESYSFKRAYLGDHEDLKVISAHLQDSIVSTKDIASLKKNKIFLMQLNRFMWEDVEKGVFRKNKRIRTILKFENVIEVNDA